MDFPGSYPGALANPWALVAAVAFSASNVPEAVPVVFAHALEELRAEQRARGFGLDGENRENREEGEKDEEGEEARREQLVLARKIREAVLQSGLLSGMPRVSVASVSVYNSCVVVYCSGHASYRARASLALCPVVRVWSEREDLADVDTRC